MITRDVAPPSIGTTLPKQTVKIDSLIRLKLPPLSRTVLQISELLRDPNVSSERLAQAVGCDPLLTARLLKMSNSSLFFREIPVISIKQAIDVLGRKTLYDIVMLGAMADGFSREISDVVYGRIVWEHSIAVGLLSREISTMLGLRGTEAAFLCGLLHDIGKILILKGDPEMFESFINSFSEIEMLKCEEEVFGLTHAEIGAYVTLKWELPEAVCSVILHHHHPQESTISTVITNIVNAGGFDCQYQRFRFTRRRRKRNFTFSNPLLF